jgi:hypothetical protein
MKRKVAKIIQILGIGLTEIILDIDLSLGTFNSIEWIKSENKIWLHMFHEDDDIQISFDFDDLDKIDKYIVYTLLASIAYN